MINKLLKELELELENQFKDNFTGLVLFGSYAKGTQTKYSDIDILLTFKKLPKERLERQSLIMEILEPFEEKIHKTISFICLNEDNLKKTFLMADISEYAKIIKDDSGEIKKLFCSLKEDYKKGLIKKNYKRDHYSIWMCESVV